MEGWDSEAWKAALDWHNSQPRPDADEAFRSHVTSTLGYEYLHPHADDWSPFYGGSLDDFLTIAGAFVNHTDAGGRRLIIRAGYTTNTAPNAFASRDADAHHIGMSVSLFIAIIDIAAYVFCQKELFPEIGDADVERSPHYDWIEIAGFFPTRAHMAGHRIHPWYYEPRLPRCPVRRSAAMSLTITMARYVWLHEFMHCALGHVGLIGAMADRGSLHEIPPQAELIGLSRKGGGAERARSIRHAMELEADWRAFRAMLFVAHHGGPNQGVAGWDAGIRMLFAIFGTYLVTWLFEQQQAHVAGQSVASHPEPARRANHLVERAAKEYPELGDLAFILPRWLAMVVEGIPQNPSHLPLPEAHQIEQGELDAMLAPYRFIEP